MCNQEKYKFLYLDSSQSITFKEHPIGPEVFPFCASYPCNLSKVHA